MQTRDDLLIEYCKDPTHYINVSTLGYLQRIFKDDGCPITVSSHIQALTNGICRGQSKI
jgi:hypothetical protein